MPASPTRAIIQHEASGLLPTSLPTVQSRDSGVSIPISPSVSSHDLRQEYNNSSIALSMASSPTSSTSSNASNSNKTLIASV